MRKYEEIKTVEFKSKNGVELTVVEGKWKEENMFSGTHFYRAFETKKGFEDGYVGSVDDSIGDSKSSWNTGKTGMWSMGFTKALTTTMGMSLAYTKETK